MAKKRKRLVRGKDWHAWAWKFSSDGVFQPNTAHVRRNPPYLGAGKWVKVKFVVVIRGKDFDAWTLRWPDGSLTVCTSKTRGRNAAFAKWVRVKFVEAT